MLAAPPIRAPAVAGEGAGAQLPGLYPSAFRLPFEAARQRTGTQLSMEAAMARALVIVDVQNDFCPGGALAVPEGNLVAPVLSDYARAFAEQGELIFASRDWHPEITRHFRAYGGDWPMHCVQESPGAAFHSDLRLPNSAVVITKGDDPSRDDYSAFQARGTDGRPLGELLRDRGVTELYVGGLATDYCVKATVLDSLAAGLRTTLLIDASRGVNLRPHDSEEAIEEMVRAGAHLTTREGLV